MEKISTIIGLLILIYVGYIALDIIIPEIKYRNKKKNKRAH
jgi:hypothetical protein